MRFLVKLLRTCGGFFEFIFLNFAVIMFSSNIFSPCEDLRYSIWLFPCSVSPPCFQAAKPFLFAPVLNSLLTPTHDNIYN